ncbi:MAG: DUF3551 domain-containing protein [Xanthobacteraceae bacterium]|nr:DUF3551 domain-containing protein [Xanthobacteraceae bacterium]
MRKIALASAIAFAAAFSGTAKADPYRWCAEYGGGRGGGTNCYFVTFQQCQAAISGNGGFCRYNTFYTGPDRRRGHGAYGMDRRWQ